MTDWLIDFVVRTLKMRTGPLLWPFFFSGSASACSFAPKWEGEVLCVHLICHTGLLVKENVGLLVFMTRRSIAPFTQQRRFWALLFKGPSHSTLLPNGPSHIVSCACRAYLLRRCFGFREVWSKHRLRGEAVSADKSARSFITESML